MRIADTFVTTANSMLGKRSRDVEDAAVATAEKDDATEAMLETSNVLLRSIDLAISYLRGVEAVDGINDLRAYLRDGRSKLPEIGDYFRISHCLHPHHPRLKHACEASWSAEKGAAPHLHDALCGGEHNIIEAVLDELPIGGEAHEDELRAQVREAIVVLHEQAQAIRHAVRGFTGADSTELV